MGTSPYVNNSLSISSLLSRFVGKNYFHGNVRTYEIGELSGIMPEGSSAGEIPQNTHRNKKGVVYAEERERERENKCLSSNHK
jgi:hypothetical protein